MATNAPRNTSFLSDEPPGSRAASAWWRVMGALERAGLVERLRYTDGTLAVAFKLTLDAEAF